MKVKDFKPKYNTIELIISKKHAVLLSMENFKDVVILYPEHEIESVKDFDDTETTSIILKDF